MKILVADDDPIIVRVLKELLEELGYEVGTASTAAGAVKAAAEGGYDLALLDLRFPDCADLSTLASVRQRAPETDVIMVTAETDNLGLVAEAVGLGAFDYVPKPIRDDDIRIRVTRVAQMRALARAHSRAVSELSRGNEFEDIVGESAAIHGVVRTARELSGHDAPALITGETGTGKELVARALHYGGIRRDRPFVSINCAALASGLTESELFGHEKGAFTGALQSRRGAFEEAEDGTLFLDEIGDMSPQAQAVLLHVLERGEYRSVGGKSKVTRARVVLASNQNIEALIADGRFRKDLFYRINRMRVHLPALRERREDVPLIARHFLRLIEAKVGKGVREVRPEALEALAAYSWPGNVRELKNEIERAHLHAQGRELRLADFSPEIIAAREGVSEEPGAYPETTEDIQRLVEALRTSGGNVTRTAEMLGMHRNTVHRWIKRYALEAR